jgi:molecular chaperone GrpE
MNDDQIKKETEESLEEETSPRPGLGEDEEGVDDVVFEDNTEVTGGDYQKKTQQLKAKIKELEAKATEYLTGWQKDKADFINLRKKDEEIKKEVVSFAKESLITDLIPVLDSFESAMKNKTAWEQVDSNWRVGVEYIAGQLSQILENNGLKKVYPLGQPFDHTRDEALEMVPTTDASQDGQILEVVQTGYMMGERIIRAPKVKVGELQK